MEGGESKDGGDARPIIYSRGGRAMPGFVVVIALSTKLVYDAQFALSSLLVVRQNYLRHTKGGEDALHRK